MTEYGVVLFYTTSAAFAAEKALAKAKINCVLVPPPRELSSDCGVALRFEWSRNAEVNQILEETGVQISGTHPLCE